MRIGVLGTGMVGRTIATRLAGLGHQVSMGSRTHDNAAAVAWAQETGGEATHGTFAQVAAQAALIFNCTSGAGSLEGVRAARAGHLPPGPAERALEPGEPKTPGPGVPPGPAGRS